MMIIKSILSASYSSKDKSLIDLIADTDTLGKIPVTVNLNNDDVTAHILEMKQWIKDNIKNIDAYIDVPKTPEQLEYEFKAKRNEQVRNITVITKNGNTFDGDEDSQNRLSRAVSSSDVGESTLWKLANNSIETVSHEELKEALRLAGDEQTRIWMA